MISNLVMADDESILTKISVGLGGGGSVPIPSHLVWGHPIVTGPLVPNVYMHLLFMKFF